MKIKSGISDAIEAWIEREIVKHADKVISVTERMTQSFVERYSEAVWDVVTKRKIPQQDSPRDRLLFCQHFICVDSRLRSPDRWSVGNYAM